MDTTSYVALSRMDVLKERMEIIANNLANLSTNGFRAEGLQFAEVLNGEADGEAVAFVETAERYRDLSEGAIVSTGNALDLAITGDGFFPVQTPEGLLYTRNGHFELSDVGEIVTSDGYPLADQGGAPIAIPNGRRDIEIAEDGTVSLDGAPLGRIAPVEFADPAQMSRARGGYFASPEEPLPEIRSRIIQGALEQSNVQPVLEITRMMETVRAFEGTQRLIETDNDIQRRLIERMLDLRG